MSESARLLWFTIAVSSFSVCMFCIASVEAIVPQVQDIIVQDSSGETILNVTVYHTPVTSTHRVDRIEVDVAGSVTSFPVVQSLTTFIVQPNLGQITGTPATRVRAHCTIDGWSSWSETFQIPEFPSWIILPLFLITTLVVIIYRNRLRSKVC